MKTNQETNPSNKSQFWSKFIQQNLLLSTLECARVKKELSSAKSAGIKKKNKQQQTEVSGISQLTENHPEITEISSSKVLMIEELSNGLYYFSGRV